jgi:hypothetical protein
MALNKEKVQDLIDDFVVSNVDQINEVATANPMVYDAVINALNLLSRKFGTIQAINIPKPATPIELEVPKANALHPSVQIGVTFIDTKDHKTKVEKINFEDEIVTFFRVDNQSPIKLKFSVVNDAIERGNIKLVQERKLALNPLVKIGSEFIQDKTTFSGTPKSIFIINDIDYDKGVISLIGETIQGTAGVSFNFVNDKLTSGEWVPYVEPAMQSNTFGALTLNPSVQVGQLYIDLEDDSNFSVLLIDQKKQVVTINWNEDDIQGEVDFEDFNDNLEAATWVIAPDQAQVTATEDEILDAIEGLELIGDAVSKKEIAELKKQLKQLKKKKP